MREVDQDLIQRLKERKKEFNSIAALSRDSGISESTLRDWLNQGSAPSKSSLKLINNYLEGGQAKEYDKVESVVQEEESLRLYYNLKEEAEERTEKIKKLLVLTHYELAWLIDAPKEARQILRDNISLKDLAYLGSLLTMLADEAFFQRWKGFTTVAFNEFSNAMPSLLLQSLSLTG